MTATKSFNQTCWNIISKALSTTTISFHLTRNDQRTTISTKTTEVTAGQQHRYRKGTKCMCQEAIAAPLKDPNGTQNSKAFEQ
jgi:hypothetical protein